MMFVALISLCVFCLCSGFVLGYLVVKMILSKSKTFIIEQHWADYMQALKNKQYNENQTLKPGLPPVGGIHCG